MTANEGQIVGLYEHFASADVNLVLERDSDTLRAECVIQLAFIGDDALHSACLSAGQSHNFVAFTDDAACHLS